PLTNSLTRINNGEIDPVTGGGYVSQLAAEGSKIFYGEAVKEDPLPKIPPLIQANWSAVPQLSTEVAIEERSYSSWPYLLPRYWIPFVYPVEGGALFQGITGGADPLGKHTYLLEGSFDTVTQKPSYGVQ